MSAQRLLAAIGRILLTAGVVVLAFAAYEVWGTGLQEARGQDALEDEFADLLAAVRADVTAAEDVPHGTIPTATALEVAPGVPVNPPLSSFDEATVLAALYPQPGSAVARLRIPAIGVDKLVVEGVSGADLRRAPGHYRATARPGFEGNVGIAGHRTTYGQPFRDIDRLVPGDRIEVTTLLGTFVYEVMTPEAAHGERLADVAEVLPGAVVVSPHDTWVLADGGDDRLTLTACHPLFSARQRIVVAARLLQPATEVPVETAAEPPADGLGYVDDDGATVGTADEGADGLEGEDDALVPALLFGATALVAYLATLAAGRGRHRFLAYALGAGPVLLAVWLCFEQVDRLLPAY